MKITTSRSYRPKSPAQRRQAISEITELIELAHATYSTSSHKAHRMAKRARRIAMKHKIRLPSHLKRRICKGCSTILIPGKTCRIRTARGHVVIYCIACKRVTRIVYKDRRHTNLATP